MKTGGETNFDMRFSRRLHAGRLLSTAVSQQKRVIPAHPRELKYAPLTYSPPKAAGYRQVLAGGVVGVFRRRPWISRWSTFRSLSGPDPTLILRARRDWRQRSGASLGRGRHRSPQGRGIRRGGRLPGGLDLQLSAGHVRQWRR